jgi:hypothetical protein
MAWPIPFACACDGRAPLWRTVLGTEELQNGGQRVVACMRCGHVGAVVWTTEVIELDPHDARRITGLEALTATPDELAWLGAWPRRVGDPECVHARSGEVFFLGALARFEDEPALERAEQRARETSSRRYDERLRAAGVPAESPPDTRLLHSRLWFFTETWEALRLPEDASAEVLIESANPMKRPASWVAEAHLPTGDGLVAAIATLIGDADTKRRRTGLGALNILKLRATGTFTLPEPILDAAAKRIAQLDPADASRSYLIHVLAAFDGRVHERLGS